jgi:outer membrane protein TolC
MKKFFIVLVLILVSSTESYILAEKINRKIVEAETLKNNHFIAVAKLNLENAKQYYNAALGAFFPKIEINSSVTPFSSLQGKALTYSYGLNAVVPIFNGFETYNNVKEQASNVKIAQASYDRTVADALYNSNAAYIDLMFAYEKIELLEKINKRIIKNRDIVKLKYNSGLIDAGALKIAEIDVLKNEHDLKAAKKDLEIASALLLQAIGRNDDSALLETDERISVIYGQLPQEPDYESLITATPEFAMAQNNFNVSKVRKARAVSQRLPSIYLAVSENKGNTPIRGLNANLSVNYKLFSGGQINSNMKIASNEFKIAAISLKNELNSLKLEAKKCYSKLLAAYELVKINNQYLDVFKLQAEISSQQYTKGLIQHQQWYDIEGRYISSQEEFLATKKTAALAIAQWRKFTGGEQKTDGTNV